MTKKRRAEAKDVRSWDRGVAQANELAELRAWIVWGVGTAPERAAQPEDAEARPGEPGNDIAHQMAAERDPEWAASDDTWVSVVRADEDEVDEWVQDQDSVRGYAPYLHAPEDAAAKPEIQKGVLRGDVVRRRKPGRFDASRPT